MTTFLLSEVIVFPQRAKEQSLKLSIAHAAKESDIQLVFPLLTAPSQIIPSNEEYGELLFHHVRVVSCF